MMMNKSAYLILSVCFLLLAGLISCGGRPSDVLSEDKMVDLLVDMELTEAYANTASLSSAQKVELGKRVLKAHGVSEESLDTTLAWYGRNLDEYSELFEKVDKKIMKRQKKYTNAKGIKTGSTENLWPYGEHLVLSELAGSNAINFSIPTSDIKKGEVLELSFAMANSTGLKNTFGVEYTDGHGEGIVNNSNNSRVKISLTTDTVRKVSRIFGTIMLRDKKGLPLLVDSIKLVALPFDSAEYKSAKRSQKTFGALVKKAPQKHMEKKDTLEIKPDSLNNKDVVSEPKLDSINSIQKTTSTSSPQTVTPDNNENSSKAPTPQKSVSNGNTAPKPVTLKELKN